MKPNTYTKLYAHCIFTPNGRESLLTESLCPLVHKYIYGTIQGMKCNPIGINGTKDHIHLLVGFNPTTCIADLIRDIKRSSAIYVNSNHLSPYKFSWQEGYGAFTVGYRQLDSVYKYILNQEAHHAKHHFRIEYEEILLEEGVEYDENFRFEFYD